MRISCIILLPLYSAAKLCAPFPHSSKQGYFSLFKFGSRCSDSCFYITCSIFFSGTGRKSGLVSNIYILQLGKLRYKHIHTGNNHMYRGHKIQDCNMTCQIIIKNNTARRQALIILIYLSHHIYIWTFNGENCVKSAEYSASKLWNSTTSNNISKPPNKLHKTALEQMIYMDPWEVRSNPLYRPLVAEKSILNKSFPEMASVISGHPNAIWCVFIWSFESLNNSVQDLKQSFEVFFILILNQFLHFLMHGQEIKGCE